MVVREPGPGERNDAQRHGEEPQKEQQAPGGGSRGGPSGAGDVGAGETQRGELADAPAQEGIDRQQRQQRQQPGVLELEVAGHWDKSKVQSPMSKVRGPGAAKLP